MINAKEHWTQPLQEAMGVVLDGEKGTGREPAAGARSE
jgi:hypothetical protein